MNVIPYNKANKETNVNALIFCLKNNNNLYT